MLPADAKFVGGIDVKKFVLSPFYTKYASPHARSRPDTFRELEEKTGLNPERDIDQLIFAGTPPGSTRKSCNVSTHNAPGRRLDPFVGQHQDRKCRPARSMRVRA